MKRILFLIVALLCGANLFAQSNSVSTATNSISHSALIPATRSTPTNWMSRHEKFVEQAKKGGIDLLFMGDSITDFWRNRGSNVWDKFYAPLHAANFGIGGDRTQHVLWRIENGELDGIHPKVCVLLIGTNNSGDDSPDDIATAIKLIVDETHAKIPGTEILLLGIFPRGPHKTKNGSVTDDGVKRMETIRAVNEKLQSWMTAVKR